HGARRASPHSGRARCHARGHLSEPRAEVALMSWRVPNIGAPAHEATAVAVRAAEGEVRPGPYMVDGGWLSATAGRFLNWWQMGHSLQSPGGNAMVEACVSAYSQTVAMCPGAHKRSTGNGGYETVGNSALARWL